MFCVCCKSSCMRFLAQSKLCVTVRNTPTVFEMEGVRSRVIPVIHMASVTAFLPTVRPHPSSSTLVEDRRVGRLLGVTIYWKGFAKPWHWGLELDS